MSVDDDALRLVDDFERDGSAGGVWRAIRKDEAVNGLRERIRNKDGLNQHNTGLCAEAALVHIELQDEPSSFVRLAIGLYTSGRAAWRGKVVTPSAELLANPPPAGQIVNGTAQVFNRADWIVMSSIRYTVNPFDSSGGTFMKDLEAFIRQVGYTSVERDYNEDSFSKDEPNARKAADLVNRGYRVILSINAAMLDSATQADWGGVDGWQTLWGLAPKPNHNVQLIQGFDFFKWYIADDSITAVRFEVYTWAEGHRRVPQNWQIPLKLPYFLWNYYGYLAFKN
jgi:hypothetical protein